MKLMKPKNLKEEVRSKKAEIMLAFGIFVSSFYSPPSSFASGISINKTFMVETNNALSTNETNFFEVNLGLLDEAIAPGGGVLGSEDWVVSQLNPPGIYVDSVFGNDANAGTEASPLQHLYAVTAALGANSTIVTNIYLKRGAKFYESFIVPTNAYLRDYSTGIKPIITGVTNLANASFSLTSGKTNTYQIALVVPIETNAYAFGLVQSNVMMVWQNNQRLGARWDQNASYNNNTNTAINSVDGNMNSFFYDLTNHILYLNTGANGNPATNSSIYEASIRTLALVGSAGCTVSNIIAEKSYAHDNTGNEGYAILGQYSGTFIDCVGRHSWNHCIGFAPSLSLVGTNVFVKCYGSDVESNIAYSGAGTVFVADASSATNLATSPACGIFSNCLAVATPAGLASASSGEFTSGFYAHEVTNLNVQLYSCTYSNCYYGCSAQTNVTVLTNCVAVNCYNGIEAIDPTNTVDHFYCYNVTNGVVAQSGVSNLIVNNSQFWYWAGSAIWGRTTTTNVFLTNNIFASSNNVGIGVSVPVGQVPIYSYNNVFYANLYCYNQGSMTNASGANTADYNNYYQNTRIGVGQAPSPGYYPTFANWQTAWPSVDPHGTTSNPGYATSNYAYAITVPSGLDGNSAVALPAWIGSQNGAGLSNLNAAQLTGLMPISVLPGGIISNGNAGNVSLAANLYVQKTNFANYEVLTNLFKGQGGGVLTGNFNDALDLYGDSGGDDISIFHAFAGNSIVFDASANVTLYGGSLSGNGSGLSSLNAGNVSSGVLGSNYLQTVFSNYAVHCAGIPAISYTAGSSQPIYTGGTMTYRSGNDFSAHYTITNGAGTGSASSGLTVFNFTPQFPFSTNVAATVNQTSYNQYGESIAGDNFVRQWWCSNNVSSAGLVTNFSILANNYGNTLASSTVYGVVVTVSGQ